MITVEKERQKGGKSPTRYVAQSFCDEDDDNDDNVHRGCCCLLAGDSSKTK